MNLRNRRIATAWSAGFVALVGTVLSQAEVVHDGFVLGSRVNVRGAPNTTAKVFTTLPVGTPVRWHPGPGEWCRIDIVTGIAVPGYILCNLITEEKPTLESIDRELATSNMTPEQESDLLARRFYLSPSLNTVALARQRKKLPAEDAWPNPVTSYPEPERKKANLAIVDKPTPDQAFAVVLLESFRGELTGQDFRPVDTRINEQVVNDMQELVSNERHQRSDYKDAPTAGLSGVTTSLFRHPYDVMALGWVTAREDGKADPVLSIETSNDMIEFSKLYPGQRLQAQHTALVTRRHEAESLYGWHKTGGVDVAFAVPPQVVVISRNRITPAKVKKVHVRLAARECRPLGERIQVASIVPLRPIFADGITLALAPHIRVTEAGRIGVSANPAIFDLNSDGIADVAYAVYTAPGEIGGDTQWRYIFVNIDGAWRMALQEIYSYCD